jgi:DNA-binding MarR family transcriptional regulator
MAAEPARADAVRGRGKGRSKAEPVLVSVREDVPQLDQLIHGKLRLGIVSALAATPSLTFSELKSLLDTTDGNLSIHARKLEEAGYVECEKSFAGRVPKSEYRLTADGRAALERYLGHMEALVRAMRKAQ